MFDRVAMDQVCVWQSGNGTGLCLTEWPWDKFVLKEWQWDRFVVDRMAMGQVCV